MVLKTRDAPPRLKCYDALIRLNTVRSTAGRILLQSPMWILFLLVENLVVIKHTQWDILVIPLEESVCILTQTKYISLTSTRSAPPTVILKYGKFSLRITLSPEIQKIRLIFKSVYRTKQRCKRVDACTQMQE